MKFLEMFIDSTVMWIAAYFAGKILLEKNIDIVKITSTIIIFSIILTLLDIVNSEILGGMIKIICVYILQCIFYKIMFKTTVSKSMVIALIWYLCLFISEIIIVLITSIVTYFNHHSMLFIKNNIIMNILIALSNLIIINLYKNKLVALIKNNSILKKSYYIVVLIILVTISLLAFKIPFNEWKLNLEFVITMSILLCFCIIGLFLLKQKADIEKTTSMYQQLASYSNVTTKLLEDYRIVSHEHKNQLSIIRGMLDDSNTELISYIDNLLNKRNIIKYQWANQLNNLPIAGLKGLLNYKLIEMESQKININISISKDIAKSKLNKLTAKQKDELYSIMGIYLDNAIEAAKMSKKKEVSLEIYKEKRDVVIILANTYSGKINLEKIDDYGYTTKGKNHGVGLHIVKKILEENSIFTQNRTLFEDYYVQELRVKLLNVNKQPK